MSLLARHCRSPGQIFRESTLGRSPPGQGEVRWPAPTLCLCVGLGRGSDRPRSTVAPMDSTTSTTIDPNRVINHAIEHGLGAAAPWLAVLAGAFVLLIVALVWTGIRRGRQTAG